jgi:uncharacterized protein YgiM (DUF1202 family)
MQGSSRTIVAMWILSGLVLFSCSNGFGSQATETRAGENVIATAQAYAEQTRQATLLTLPPTPITPSPTATVATPTPEPTATQSFPIVVADMNARVRSGPSEDYPIIDFFTEGTSAQVVGRYENTDYEPATWWSISRIGEGKDGWVWSGVVTLSGNEAVVPFLELPPTPEGD